MPCCECVRFTGLSVNVTHTTAFVLIALLELPPSSLAPLLSLNITTAPFFVTPPVATSMAVASQPAAFVLPTLPFNASFVVRDAAGDALTIDDSSLVRVSAGSAAQSTAAAAAASFRLAGTVVRKVSNGSAVFADLSLDKVGAYTLKAEYFPPGVKLTGFPTLTTSTAAVAVLVGVPQSVAFTVQVR